MRPNNKPVEIEQISADTDPLEDRVLLTEIVRAIVQHSAAVRVTERIINNEHVQLLIAVDPRDHGQLLGKQGKTINAVRTIFHAIGGADRKAFEIVLVGTGGRRIPSKPPSPGR